MNGWFYFSTIGKGVGIKGVYEDVYEFVDELDLHLGDHRLSNKLFRCVAMCETTEELCERLMAIVAHTDVKYVGFVGFFPKFHGRVNGKEPLPRLEQLE